MNEHYKKAKNVCERVGKPAQANAKALDSLFPFLQNKKRHLRKVWLPKSIERRRRAKNLKVVFLKQKMPKGNARDVLSQQGRIKDVPVKRNMTAPEVTDTIMRGFKIADSYELVFLKGHRDNTLTVIDEQSLDGTAIINLAGSGSVYVTATPVRKSSSPSPSIDQSPPIDQSLSPPSIDQSLSPLLLSNH